MVLWKELKEAQEFQGYQLQEGHREEEWAGEQGAQWGGQWEDQLVDQKAGRQGRLEYIFGSQPRVRRDYILSADHL